jgi:hypothetical protein
MMIQIKAIRAKKNNEKRAFFINNNWFMPTTIKTDPPRDQIFLFQLQEYRKTKTHVKTIRILKICNPNKPVYLCMINSKRSPHDELAIKEKASFFKIPSLKLPIGGKTPFSNRNLPEAICHQRSNATIELNNVNQVHMKNMIQKVR